jgi:hypothetical protein
MDTSPLLSDVETFLKSTGMAESTFGRGAANDWKFVRELRDGRWVRPATERRVRDFMDGHSETNVTSDTPLSGRNEDERTPPDAALDGRIGAAA